MKTSITILLLIYALISTSNFSQSKSNSNFSGTLVSKTLQNVKYQAQQLSKMQKWQQPSYFRGFNIGLWCSDSDCEKTQQDITALKNSGANLAQIGVYGVGFRYPQYPYASNPEGIEWITRMVNYCRNAKIQYVIAVRVGPGRLDVSDDQTSTVWVKDNTYQAQMYGKMLKEIAEAFLPDTLFVGLNLTVEPNPFGSTYLSPAELKQTLIENQVDLYKMYKTWIDSVRKVAPKLPLIVQSAQFSNPEYWGDPVLIKKQYDPYIVYDFHTYEPFDDFTHYPSINGATYPATAWNETLQDDVLWDSTFYANVVFAKVKAFQQTYNVPIFVGEFGIFHPQNNGAKYLKDIYEIAINNKWHFALWTWRANGSTGKIYFDYERFDEVASGENYWSTVKSFFSDTNTSVNNNSNYPDRFKLYQNYPNPFNPTTKIKYSIPRSRGNGLSANYKQQVVLKVYDILGKEVVTLVNKRQSTGYYEIEFGSSPLPSGVYLYRLQVSGANNSKEFVQTKKMILLR